MPNYSFCFPELFDWLKTGSFEGINKNVSTVLDVTFFITIRPYRYLADIHYKKKL